MNNLVVGERYNWFNKRTSSFPVAGWSGHTKEYLDKKPHINYYAEPGFSINTHIIIEFLRYNPDGSCVVKVVNKKGEELIDGPTYNGLVEECLKQV